MVPKDPFWFGIIANSCRLIAVNAVSLVCALVANTSLLLNMARRVRFAVAQPVTISGFYIASILLIALVAVASDHFQAPGVKVQALTQAYYYANFAAGLYFIIASLMCITVYGAHKGHYSKDFKLTISQRTLMLQTMSFMVYLLLGALVFHKIEGWKFLDALYWADFTCLTIGIGDFAPATHLGRGLLFPYAIGGIVILGLVVGSIRSLVLDRGKKKMSARMTEKTRKAVLRRIKTQEDSKTGHTTITHKRKFGLGGTTTFSLHPIVSGTSYHGKDNTLSEASVKYLERERRISEFHAMRYVQNMAAVERKWLSLFISLSAWFILWFIGALVFSRAEQEQPWSYFYGLYFAYTSLLTIGYGDLVPFSNFTKPFFVFWSLLAVPTLTILTSDMSDTVIKSVKEITLYLGELTLLPADREDLSYWDRVSYGILRLSGGHVDLSTKHQNSAIQNSKSRLGQNKADKGSTNLSHVEVESRFEATTFQTSSRSSNINKTRTPPSPTHSEPSSTVLPKTPVDGEVPVLGDRPHLVRPTSHSHFLLLLLQEIKTVYTHHLNTKPPKLYTYEEWERFLHLIGKDEADAAFHRAPPVGARTHWLRHRRRHRSNNSSGNADSNTDDRQDNIENTDDEVFNGKADEVSTRQDSNQDLQEEEAMELDKREEEEEREMDRKWSWMGDRSPLMGEKDEAEWVIERLVGVLERELKVLHRREGETSEGAGT